MYFFIPGDEMCGNDDLFYKHGFPNMSNMHQYLAQTISGYIDIYKVHYFNNSREMYNVYYKNFMIGVIYESESWEKFVIECYDLSERLKNSILRNDSNDENTVRKKMFETIQKWKASGD